MDCKYTQLFTRVDLPAFEPRFAYGQSLCLIGSCFAENLASYLSERKFDVRQNPFGILFNPLSMEQCVSDCLGDRIYTADDYLEKNGVWFSWNHHGSISGSARGELEEKIGRSRDEGRKALSDASWVILSLGSARVYFRAEDGRLVANCHQMPSSLFQERRLSVEECGSSLARTVEQILECNPSAHILLTVSPIRHWKDGAHENQLSKSTLLLAVERCRELLHPARALHVHYFPAYELMMDELRDYRFYADDMVHPSSQAVRRIMEAFCEKFLSVQTQSQLPRVEEVLNGFAHRPLRPDSDEYVRFAKKLMAKAKQLQSQIPGIDFAAEILSLQVRISKPTI